MRINPLVAELPRKAVWTMADKIASWKISQKNSTCEKFDEYSSQWRGANDDVEENDRIVRVSQRRGNLQMQVFE